MYFFKDKFPLIDVETLVNPKISKALNQGILKKIRNFSAAQSTNDIETLIRKAVRNVSIKENDIGGWLQLTSYDWINKDMLECASKRLGRVLDENNITCEIEASHSFKRKPLLLTGFIDCVDRTKKIVWEFKFVNEIKDEHYLQLMIYKYLLGKEYKDFSYRLFNIKNNEIIELSMKESAILKMINSIYEIKNSKKMYIK